MTDLRALNSLTKYPSIPTYHELDPKNGGLLENPIDFHSTVIGTEKVDGTNARIVLQPGGPYLIGSREHLLYAQGDLVGDPAQGIVENLRAVADALPPMTGYGDGDTALVYFLELFGGKIGGNAKQYSTRGAVGWRLFDVAAIDGFSEKLQWPAEKAATWRDGGGQVFANEDVLEFEAQLHRFELTPRLFTIEPGGLPLSIEGMAEFLKQRAPATQVALDDSGLGLAEGLVLRDRQRGMIAKARFADYERTLKRRSR